MRFTSKWGQSKIDHFGKGFATLWSHEYMKLDMCIVIAKCEIYPKEARKACPKGKTRIIDFWSLLRWASTYSFIISCLDRKQKRSILVLVQFLHFCRGLCAIHCWKRLVHCWPLVIAWGSPKEPPLPNRSAVRWVFLNPPPPEFLCKHLHPQKAWRRVFYDAKATICFKKPGESCQPGTWNIEKLHDFHQNLYLENCLEIHHFFHWNKLLFLPSKKFGLYLPSPVA